MTAPSTAASRVSYDHRLPFVYKVTHEEQGQAWAHAQVFQDQDGLCCDVTTSLAQHLLSMGAVGQVVGDLTSARLVVTSSSVDVQDLARFDRSLNFTLGRCTNAMGGAFQKVTRDDNAQAGVPFTSGSLPVGTRSARRLGR